MTQQQASFNYCLRLGDNALVLGHRLSEWCSKGPILEEDLALTNFALDFIGRAQALLKYAGEIEGKNRTEDDLAYRRPERQFYNHLITELPNGDFAFTQARQLLISAFEYYFYSELCKSKDETLSGIAAKTLKEVRYHLAHASDWVVRLGDGTEESHNRLQKAINDLWMFTGELFETDETDELLIKASIGVDINALHPKWKMHIENVLKEATLEMPDDEYMQTGSRKGIHTEHLGYILADMQYLQRAYPDAKW